MKSPNLFLAVIILGSILSCAPQITYYQVYKTATEGLQKGNEVLTYQNDTCEITYNLWSDGGNVGFRFYNKTDQNIYLHLDECFFVLNGNAYNYFKNRTYTVSSGTGAAVSAGASGTKSIGASGSVTGVNPYTFLQTNSITTGASLSVYSSSAIMASKGFAIAISEDKIICIPAKTAKIINEYLISNTVYRDCDLLRFPIKKETAVKTFTKSTSPFVFSNRIVFNVGQKEALKKIENEFYVTKISNLSEDKLLKWEKDERCGEKSVNSHYFFKNAPADEFYIEYERPSNAMWKY